ncbi:MAG: hypothetical protein ACR2GX_04275 [Candidatus Dormibacteria bacterium]
MTAVSKVDGDRGEILAFRAGRALLAIRGLVALASWALLLDTWRQSAPGIAMGAFALVLAGGTLPLAWITRRRRGAAYALAVSVLFLDFCLQFGLLLSRAAMGIPLVVLGADVLTTLVLSLRDNDRVRGSGWLDCPDCGEHAQQDVVDRLRFVRLFGYRLGIIHRHRHLLCRRCQYRRRAGQEMRALNTAGTPIRHAWLAPVGLIGLLLSALVVYFGFVAAPPAAEAAKISYLPVDASTEVAAPYTYDEPVGWNHNPDIDPKTKIKYEHVSITTSDGQTDIFIRRFPTDASTSLGGLVVLHYKDDANLGTPDYPATPPKAACATVGGQKAAKFTVAYDLRGQKAESTFYVFVRQSWAYVIDFTALQPGAITALAPIRDHIISSFKFTGSEPPAPVASPSPSPGPTAPTPATTPLNGGSPAEAIPSASATPIALNC